VFDVLGPYILTQLCSCFFRSMIRRQGDYECSDYVNFKKIEKGRTHLLVEDILPYCMPDSNVMLEKLVYSKKLLMERSE